LAVRRENWLNTGALNTCQPFLNGLISMIAVIAAGRLDARRHRAVAYLFLVTLQVHYLDDHDGTSPSTSAASCLG